MHDGPGLRTTVFMKGCSLRCRWCHSPESQDPRPEPSYSAETCTGCGACADACPAGLLARGPAELYREACRACGSCASACYAGALRLVGHRTGVPELLALLLRDRLLYEASGGGVTVSGGEPALQPEFIAALLRDLRERGVHTAVETSGHVPWTSLEMVLDHADLVLYDLKHPVDETHRALTGAGNRLILANLSRLAGRTGGTAARLVVRLPVIPGLNDDPRDLSRTAAILAALPALDGVQLLPYHDLGVPKYAALGRSYDLRETPAPTPAHLTDIAGLLSAHGLEVTIEGMTADDR